MYIGTLFGSGKRVGLELKTEWIMCMFMSHQQSARHNNMMETASGSFENMA